GGSVIGALYAYSDDGFPAFEARLRAILRRGLFAEIVQQTLHPRVLVPATLHFAASSAAAAVTRGVTEIARGATVAVGLIAPETARWMWRPFAALQSPVRRPVTRTTGFSNALARIGLGQSLLADVRRGDLKVIFNTTELRTGTAFRFGSALSGG